MVLESVIRDIGLVGVTAIVFAENGLLIGFFLPGDSLLFTAGFLSSQGYFGIWELTILVTVASIVGNTVGYAFGSRYGRRLFQRPNSRFFKQENLLKTQAFYEKHGVKTIVLARFIPVVRTFAPIVAGIAQMGYRTFTVFNIIGGIIWAAGMTLLGFWLGTKVSNVDKYLLPIIALIIILSVLPGIMHMLKEPEQRRGLIARIRHIFRRR
jgi:membrane-associated protein